MGFPSADSGGILTIECAPEVLWTLANAKAHHLQQFPDFKAGVKALLSSHHRLRYGVTAPQSPPETCCSCFHGLFASRSSKPQKAPPQDGSDLGSLPPELVLAIIGFMAPVVADVKPIKASTAGLQLGCCFRWPDPRFDNYGLCTSRRKKTCKAGPKSLGIGWCTTWGLKSWPCRGPYDRRDNVIHAFMGPRVREPAIKRRSKQGEPYRRPSWPGNQADQISHLLYLAPGPAPQHYYHLLK